MLSAPGPFVCLAPDTRIVVPALGKGKGATHLRALGPSPIVGMGRRRGGASRIDGEFTVTHTIRPRTCRDLGAGSICASFCVRALAAMVGALLATAAVAPAQTVPGTAVRAPYTLRGNVRAPDESRLVGAHVTMRIDAASTAIARGEALTDDNGTFRFDRLPEGSARLIVRRLGFHPETLTVEVPQLPGGPVAILLDRSAQPLAPVVVREARRVPVVASPFERRRIAGFGHYITRAEIEHENPQRTTELLRRIPGVSLGSGDGSTGLRFRAGGGGAGTCEPVYFLDGSPMGAGTLDLDAVSPSSIEAIEVYNGAATVPAALRTMLAPGGCGAIAVWSRRADLIQRSRIQAAATLDSLDGIVALGMAFTADQVELAVSPLPGFAPLPAYPDSLRDAGVGGRVVAEFVVDEHGRVAAETFGIVSSTHPLFANAVREAITAARFSPAYREGHVVRQVVQLPVVFEPGSSRSGSSSAPASSPAPE